MKRRFAYSLGDNYKKIYINDEMFKGYVCDLKLNNIDKPLIVFDGKNNICIRDNGYEWIEVYPDKRNYAITIIFDQNKNIIEWYFDIAKKIGIENDIPYEDDLYLDLIITSTGEKRIIDEDELKEALENNDITKDEFELAYCILKELDEKYYQHFDYLIDFTDYLCNKLNIKLEIKK